MSDLLAQSGIDVPDEVQISSILTDYSVETRYPGDYEPVTEAEYLEALEIADEVYQWARTGFAKH